MEGLKTMAIGAAMALAAGSAWAQAPQKDGKGAQGNMAGAFAPPFSALDKDDDGSLTKVEAAADTQAYAGFDSADKDNDGKVSREEYRDFFADNAGAGVSAPLTAFVTLDANKDKYLSLAEAGVDTRVAQRFSQADKDGDKRLSAAEYRDLLANVMGLPEPKPLGAQTK